MADFTFKIIVVGSSGVGKTAVVQRYVRRSFKEHDTSTIGVDIGIKLLRIDNYKIQLKIWDSAGSERFKSLTTSYYRNADAAILMYGIDNARSLHDLHTWSNEVNDHTELFKILVGNKNDLDGDRKIFEETAINFSLMEKIDLAVECSAKVDDNVDFIFYSIAKNLLSKELDTATTKQQGKRSKSTKPQTGMVKYQGTSPSMDNLFHSPERPASAGMGDTNLQLDKIRPQRTLFQRLCTIL